MSNKMSTFFYKAKFDSEEYETIYSLYVRVMRQYNNLSREEFAKRICIDKRKLLAIENGLLPKTDISDTEQKKIEDNLQISYSGFVQILLDKGKVLS